MLIFLIPAAVTLGAGWAAFALYRIWRAVPRSNADFDVV
jgi:hypothetical protein